MIRWLLGLFNVQTIECSVCHGQGYTIFPNGKLPKCYECDGKGWIRKSDG